MSESADKTVSGDAGSPANAASAPSDASATVLDSNPFAGPEFDTPAKGVSAGTTPVTLPPALRSIADQLPPQVSANLKACDVTRAEVILAHEGGQPTEPIRFSHLLFRDFARAVSARLGRGGVVWCEVKEAGKPDWGFAFETPAPAPGSVDASSSIDARFARLEALLSKRLEEIGLEASLGGGGGRKSDSLRDTLQLLRDMGVIGGQSQGAGQFAEMAKAFAELQRVGADAQRSAISQLLESRTLTDQLGMGKTPEKSTAAELKEILEIGPVKQITDAMVQAGVKKALGQGAASGSPAQPNPENANGNPFADLGAA